MKYQNFVIFFFQLAINNYHFDIYSVWKVSKYGVFLVRIFPHLDWIRTRKNSIFGHFSRSDSFMHYRTAGYFHYFVVCIVVLYAFEFSYGEIMIRFLISHAFYGGGLVRKRCLLECSAYSDLSLKSFCVYLRAIAC